MTIAIVGSIVLAVVVFAFVLEPVLRAREDRVVLDEIAGPQPAQPFPDDDEFVSADGDDETVIAESPSRRPVQVDRPLGGDVT